MADDEGPTLSVVGVVLGAILATALAMECAGPEVIQRGSKLPPTSSTTLEEGADVPCLED